MTSTEVPAAARLVRDFVNAYEPQTGEESWVDCDALRVWLIERQLAAADAAAVQPDDLAAAVTVREGLRSVLLTHAGHDLEPDAAAALDTALADLPVRVRIDAHGYHLGGTRTDTVGQALGQLLDAVRQSTQDGSWGRLKVCARDTCRWAYYDASRNQVRRWCSMAGCGNYVKMRRASAARSTRTHTPTSDRANGQPVARP